MGSDVKHHLEDLILSRKNHEKWFRKVEFKAKSKGYFYVTEITRERFAWIQREGSHITASNKQIDSTNDTINDITSKFEKLGGSWNIEKAKTYDQDTAKFFSQLTDLLSDDDQAVFEEYGCAVEVWKYLKTKYSKTSESTASTYMTKIQSFPNNFDVETKGIDNAWETLKGYRRRLAAAHKGLKNIYPDKALFHILCKTLPSKYTAVLDGFRANPTITTEERLQILQEKEEDSRFSEKAHPSFNKSYSRNCRRNSDVSMIDAPETARKMLCYRCDGENHVSRDCPYAEKIKAYGIELQKKDKKTNRKQRKVRQSENRIKKDEKMEFRNRKTRKVHGHTACEEISDSSSYDSPTDSSSKESESDFDCSTIQKVMLSRALISKSVPANWVLDTGATSPMTDQIHLFRGKLKKINRTTIQVGGGLLASSYRGTVVVKCEDGSSGIAHDVFYVPNLGVNLLSAKQLCRTGMKGHFDENNVWIKDGSKTMIHAAQIDGLYIVKHIATNLRGKSLDTRLSKQSACSATNQNIEID
ncbi:hypothetical protein OnM2_054079, partial [Erysiphe neolycopersici]